MLPSPRRFWPILCLVTLLRISTNALASEEQYVPWTQTAIQGSFSADVTSTRIGRADLIIDGKEGKIEKISLQINGKNIVIPPNAYNDVEDIILTSVRLTTETGYDPTPWLYLNFDLGKAEPGVKGPNKKQLVIAIQGQKVIRRYIKRASKDPAIVWEFEEKKL